MNVGELKEVLSGVEDDVEVVVYGSDHSYWSAGGTVVWALKHRETSPYEPDYTQVGHPSEVSDFHLETFGPLVEVLLVEGR